MNRTVINRTVITSFASLLLLTQTIPAHADPLYDELLVCRDLRPDDARLICFDAAIDRSRQQGESGLISKPQPAAPEEPATAATANTAAAEISQEELFGKSEDELRRAIEQVSGNERIDRLEARVTRLQVSASGKVVVTLDNAQIWRQTDSTKLLLSEGDEVNIRKGAFDSYLMQKLGSKRSMRVKRVD